MSRPYDDAHRDRWNPGDTAHFEYHCLMDPSSSDYHLWKRTQQPVKVLGLHPDGDDFSADLPTAAARADEGVPLTYKVQFGDSHVDDATEDELLTHPKHYQRAYSFLPENVGKQGAIQAQIVRSADAEQAKSTGGMIALLPRQQDAEMLAVPGGEPVEDLHMTVIYFGEDVSDIDSSEVLDACYNVAEQFVAIDAKVFATAVFNPGGDDPCAVYLIGDNPDIPEMYRQLREVAESIPGSAEQHDPYFPHITIAYNPMAELTYQGPITFDRLLLAWAGDKKVIPL